VSPADAPGDIIVRAVRGIAFADAKGVCVRLTVVAVLMLGLAAAAGAQPPEPPPENGALRLGALTLRPGIGLESVGYNSNILNRPDDPQDDITWLLRPSLDVWARVWRVRVQAHGTLYATWFREHTDEQSLDGSQSLRLEAPVLHRLSVFASDSWVQTRDFVDPEIYVRARRVGRATSLGGALRIGNRTTIDLSGTRSRIDFDSTAELLDTTLEQTLDRRVNEVALGMRYRLTPLTTLLVTGNLQGDRFDYIPARDADSTRVQVGVSLTRPAWLSGDARVGYVRFNARQAGARDTNTVIAALDVSRPLGDATTIGARVDRDLAASFRVEEQYYVVTSVTGSIARRLSKAWSVNGSVGRQWLAYDGSDGETDPASDVLTTVGAGVDYRIWRSIVVGADADFHVGRATRPPGTRERLRVNASIQYGF
jgi:hypothetical protein